MYQKLQSCDACFLRYEVWHFWVIQQPRKLKLCKNKNKKPRDITFLQMCKWRSYDVCFLRQKVQLRKILAIFGHFTPWQPGKLKFETMKKMPSWRYYFTHVHQKWWSYNLWLLRYGVQQTDFFSFWAIFCPYITLTNQKTNQKNKNEYKSLETLSF